MTYGDPSSATRTDCDEDMRPLQRGDGRHVTTRGRVVHAVGWSRRRHLSLCAVRTKRARRRQGETRRRTWAAIGGHHACRLIAITTWNRGHPVRRSTSCESYPRDGGSTTSVRERVSLLSAGLHAPSISTARTPRLSCAPETTSREQQRRMRARPSRGLREISRTSMPPVDPHVAPRDFGSTNHVSHG